jgi:hypothetical protein
MRKSYEGALATLSSSRLLKYHNYKNLEAGGRRIITGLKAVTVVLPSCGGI